MHSIDWRYQNKPPVLGLKPREKTPRRTDCHDHTNFNYQALLDTLREICADFACTVRTSCIRLRGLPLQSSAGAMPFVPGHEIIPTRIARCTNHGQAGADGRDKKRASPFGDALFGNEGGEPDPRHLQGTAVAAAFRP